MQIFSKNSLQWQAALNTFTSIMIAGFIAIGLSGYIVFSQSSGFDDVGIELYIYHGLAVIILILVALAFSARTYYALLNPMSSLAKVTDALPLLSEKKYVDAHKIFEELDNKAGHLEINQLKLATIELAKLLEKLDIEVTENHKTIQSQNQSLDLDRRFIRGLMDTAQLIILTIDENFEVTLFNQHGENLTGFSKEQMLKSHVSRMFPSGNWAEAQSLFISLLTDKISIAQQESELIDHHNEIKHISWLHSRIKDSDGKPAILSVGLDMTEKKMAEKHVVWLAEHDSLTDLCNRRKFSDDFEKFIQMAIRYQHGSALLTIDLDNFKDINDTCGHQMGDDVLKSVAKALQKITRFTDLLARIGGDEFAVVMPETDEHGADTLASKIIKELNKITVNKGKFSHKVSASIGIVHYPLHNVDAAQLLSFADLAMSHAKQNGKGMYHRFSDEDHLQENIQNRVYWKHQIQQALEHGYFELFLQPILKINSNTIEHYELLLRMHNPEINELVLPEQFMDIAEQTGLIHQIDHWVLSHGIHKLADLHEQGQKVSLSLNLSAAIVDDPVIIPLLKQLINKYQIDTDYLFFEITETLAISNLFEASQVMQLINSLGCSFAMDDFGVGFSSFNYMRELPIDIIKIDGVFIKNLHKNKDDQLFVKALVDVAKGLGKKTIAEFVENDEILTLLRTLGVDYAQGYHIGKPEPKPLGYVDWPPQNS